ncbi:MAG: hypothetical protein HZR80_11200 [Candidatus Heimdallarchaeota archaeon]
MQSKTKKTFLLSIIFVTILAGMVLSVNNVKANKDDDDISVTLKIIYANYGDFDDDKVKDDIIIIVKLKANIDDYAKCYWYMKLELPSGKTFYFSFNAVIRETDGAITIIITTFDSAKEPGCYEATLTGIFFIEDIDEYLVLEDEIKFDPPGIGPGDPTASMEIIY